MSLWVDGEQGWQECKKDKFESKFVKKAAVSQFKKIDTAAPGRGQEAAGVPSGREGHNGRGFERR